MLVSIVEFVDLVLQKRRAVAAVLSLTLSLLFVTVTAPILQAHHAGITAYIQSTSDSQGAQEAYSNPDAVTSMLSQMAADIGQTAHTSELRTLKGSMAVAADITGAEEAAVHGVGAVFLFAFHSVIATLNFTLRLVTTTGSIIRHTVDAVFRLPTTIIHVGSLIRPSDRTPVPTITQMRAQQASIIQSGTKDVTLSALTSGVGGACDNGEGNGGYPLGWCNAGMDSVATIPYAAEPINRECTSYAYWYFTAVEGNTDFKAWGNAKYWARSSNYPTHATPAVGAIAVETAGAYGHVAIVQALPNQTYDGQVVPQGYILVSEMNYDWQGHFRYSYSPLSKFSTYIY